MKHHALLVVRLDGGLEHPVDDAAVGAASVEMQLGDGWRVSLDDRLLGSLEEWLRPENVEVIYS